MDLRERLIVALDVPSAGEALELARELVPVAPTLKIGMELFYAGGPQVVLDLLGLGARVFLDLKLHDIPNTVAGATRSLCRLGVWMVNFHVAGGTAMLKAAKAAAAEFPDPPLLIGVTVLTSLGRDDLLATGVAAGPAVQTLALSRLAGEVGLDGVVASAQDASGIKARGGPNGRPSGLLVVSPGIRPRGAETGDQIRHATPGEAVQSGSDFLVVGRPITGATDRRGAALRILEEMEAAL